VNKKTKSAPELLVQLDTLIEDVNNNPKSIYPLQRLFNALPKDSQDTLRKILVEVNK